MHGTYIGNGRVLVAPAWGGKLLVPADDLSIAPDMVLHGFYDKAFTNFLVKTVKPGQRCFDVGANLGVFTVLMGYLVGPSGSVTAYEVSPRVLPFLRDNVAFNYLGDRVQIMERAAYSREDVVDFHATLRFQGNGSLVPHDRSYVEEYLVDEFETMSVPAEALDDRIGREPVDLVKIDVEGAEPDVFAGMEASLEAGLVRTVVFELLRERIRDRMEDFGKTLRRHWEDGWRFSRLDAEGELVPLGFEYLMAVGRFEQVVMQRPD